MDSSWRNRLIVGAAVVAAVWLGVAVADQELGKLALIALIAAGAVLAWSRWARPEAVILAFVMVGYTVGNRGFAQVMPLNSVPLLFAEGALAAGLLTLLRGAMQQRLPIRRDWLNGALLALLLLGSLRMFVDFPRDRFFALRDFATIYYIGFFFIAQELALEPRQRKLVIRAFVAAAMGLIVIVPLYQRWPGWFFTQLVYNGVPLIAIKDDLAATFLLASLFPLLELPRARVAMWRWLVGAAALLIGASLLSREALLGLLVAAAIAFAAGRRRVLRLLLIAGPLGALGGLAAAFVDPAPIEHSRVYALYEHAVSVFDVSGRATYRSPDSVDSGDNNRFRLVWWGSITRRVIDENPWLGLGFGYDLARDFVQRYTLIGEDFDVRSPHSIVFTIIGRLGLAGTLLFLAAVAAMAAATRRAIRALRPSGENRPAAAARADAAAEHDAVPLWLAAWVILVSACFGVVLEGPMGAVVFWTLLGLASGTSARLEETETAPEGVSVDASIPTRATAELAR